MLQPNNLAGVNWHEILVVLRGLFAAAQQERWAIASTPRGKDGLDL
ncbi:MULTISPECIES: hypothetical protein [Synechocystis]|uniref:Uncharacterized protein n=1 Tax=Synechocystis salina LEGE 00031 TaxID=1828736 RepID=A0ABR9VQY0_9SYNC|nr:MULTISPECIES: hypothetical protein [Synechocystis]MBE9195975.1 hypothetical protein [Synechocystis sp. LEGE 06083]MBE9239789.1 hypothetical protein [Synechocystis salina LEGE 00041]MBE9252923.1 hypothetical protein [Synechocystis salina LEGE 00031]